MYFVLLYFVPLVANIVFSKFTTPATFKRIIKEDAPLIFTPGVNLLAFLAATIVLLLVVEYKFRSFVISKYKQANLKNKLKQWWINKKANFNSKKNKLKHNFKKWILKVFHINPNEFAMQLFIPPPRIEINNDNIETIQRKYEISKWELLHVKNPNWVIQDMHRYMFEAIFNRIKENKLIEIVEVQDECEDKIKYIARLKVVKPKNKQSCGGY